MKVIEVGGKRGVNPLFPPFSLRPFAFFLYDQKTRTVSKIIKSVE